MQEEILPVLELPTLDLSSSASENNNNGFFPLDEKNSIVVDFSLFVEIEKQVEDDENNNLIDWRDHEEIKKVFPGIQSRRDNENNDDDDDEDEDDENDEENQKEKEKKKKHIHPSHSNFPHLVGHFDVEPCSGLFAHLLHGSLVKSSKSSSSANKKQNANNQSNAKSPNKQNETSSPYYQQQQKKQVRQQTQKGSGIANRGEIPTSAAAPMVTLSADEFLEDWYEIMGVEDESISESQLKSQFRRRCLETHPDKHHGSDELFKKVQRAYEILGNAEARKSFDSSRDFDDSLPSEGIEFDEKPKEFFDVYRPVFARNARFSINPVTNVNLGDEKTPVAEVKKFYDFWLNFRTWRDFSHVADVEEIQEGMSREEKRWYQKENERVLGALKRQEAKRVRILVDRAMDADPRLRAEARRIEQEREAVKKAKEEAFLQVHIEKGRVEREQAANKAEEKRKAEEAVVKAKQHFQDTKASVFKALNEKQVLDPEGGSSKALVDDMIKPANVEWMFTRLGANKHLNAEELADKILNPSCDDEEVGFIGNFNRLVQVFERSIGKTRYGEPVKANSPIVEYKTKQTFPKTASTTSASSAAASKNAEWDEEDLVLLTKAIAKFPGGTVNRWRRLAVMLREKFTEEQILVKTKELEAANKSKGAGGVGMSGGVSSNVPGKSSETSSSPASGENNATATSTSTTTNDVEDWTTKQQSQLEEGLRVLKAYKEKDKFVKISESVTGKNAKQCFERYKYLVSLSKKAK